MKMNPVKLGKVAVITPIPLLILAVIALWVIYFFVGMHILGYETVPFWLLIISELPLFISPLLCVFGIVYGVIKRREHRAWLGVLLSSLGLLENCLIFGCIIYVGKRFRKQKQYKFN